MNILEVNKTDYESCNSDHPLHNWTRGAGRDVVPLNVTRNYYFISGKGFCYGGMKLAVHVENPPPPPTASPLDEKSGSPSSIFRSQYVLPTVFAIGALWDAFVRFWQPHCSSISMLSFKNVHIAFSFSLNQIVKGNGVFFNLFLPFFCWGVVLFMIVYSKLDVLMQVSPRFCLNFFLNVLRVC